MKVAFLLPIAILSTEAFSQARSSTPALQLEDAIPHIGAPSILNEDGTGFANPEMIKADAIAERSIVLVAGGRWPNPKAVDTCWVNPEQGPNIVKDVQAKINAEYKKAGIGFAWNGKCTNFSKPNQIRVYLKPSISCVNGPVSAGGGSSYVGPVNAQLGGSDGPGTMHVNVCRDRTDWPQGKPQWHYDYTLATFVHEFGHAMGLAHEQERTDAPVCRDQRGTLTSGSRYVWVTPYDASSIMNYCKTGNVNSLTAYDVKGLNYLYPNTGGGGGGNTIVGTYQIKVRANNKCVVGSGAGTSNGTKVIAYDCKNQNNHKFQAVSAGTDSFYLKNVHAKKCLDVPGSSGANGAQLQLYTCNHTNAQKFRLEDSGQGWVRMINWASKKCVDLDVPSGKIQQWDCGNEGNKQFGFFQTGKAEPIAFKDLELSK